MATPTSTDFLHTFYSSCCIMVPNCTPVGSEGLTLRVFVSNFILTLKTYEASGTVSPFNERIEQIILIFVLTKWKALLQCLYVWVDTDSSFKLYGLSGCCANNLFCEPYFVILCLAIIVQLIVRNVKALVCLFYTHMLLHMLYVFFIEHVTYKD